MRTFNLVSNDFVELAEVTFAIKRYEQVKISALIDGGALTGIFMFAVRSPGKSALKNQSFRRGNSIKLVIIHSLKVKGHSAFQD